MRRRLACAVLWAACLGLAAAPARAGYEDEFVPVPLERTAVGAKADPAGVWTPAEMDEDPKGSDVYAGALRLGQATAIVSQRVSAACGSPSDCPVRVVVATKDGSRRVLLQQEQACAAPAAFALRPDLSALRACSQVLPLADAAGPPTAAGTAAASPGAPQ